MCRTLPRFSNWTSIEIIDPKFIENPSRGGFQTNSYFSESKNRTPLDDAITRGLTTIFKGGFDDNEDRVGGFEINS